MSEINIQNGSESIQFKKYNIDEATVIAHCQEFENSQLHISEEELRLIISLMDLTTLEATDTDEKVVSLCQKAMQPTANTHTAAVCVYPNFISLAKEQLKNSNVTVATVATGFPHGQIPLELKLQEVKYCVSQGADDIDIVLSRKDFLEENYQKVFDEIKAIKALCGSAHLKVILEVGELKDLSLIRLASDLSIAAGADFIKTSTGKIPQAANLPASMLMLQSIKQHFDETGKKVGFKPAGGIRTPLQAMSYLHLLQSIPGKDWLTPGLFRFGASSLLDQVLLELNK